MSRTAENATADLDGLLTRTSEASTDKKALEQRLDDSEAAHRQTRFHEQALLEQAEDQCNRIALCMDVMENLSSVNVLHAETNKMQAEANEMHAENLMKHVQANALMDSVRDHQCLISPTAKTPGIFCLSAEVLMRSWKV
jgi:hypothetical protein